MKKNDFKNDEAVSPVIGVILMVSITVILAAIIAAFVFGMVGDVKGTKTVAFTAKQESTNSIIIMNMGGQDVNKLSVVSVTTNTTITGNTTLLNVGGRLSVPKETTPQNVVVLGTFTDGTTQVLLDTYV